MKKKDYCCTLSALGSIKNVKVAQSLDVLDTLMNILASFLLMKMSEGIYVYIPYILESNAHTFYSFRGLKSWMRIRFACILDSQSRDGFWKNDTAAVHIRTI
jgi:hypothetical protein